VDQVFSNLIDNALKYLVDGRPGKIAVLGRREAGMVVITVQDNGRGIASRDLERVFELFRRAGNQDRPGEGIGLAHVKALVRRLGGTIECTSNLGEGSVFSVRLPGVLTHAGSELR
jgi:signal transduction histidine kinase